MNKYDEVIEEFLSNDPLREALMKPCLIGDHVYASNGYIAIKIPISKLPKTYEPNPDYPDIIPLFEKREGMFEKPKILKAEKIETLLKEIPEKNISVECQKCEGDGSIPSKGKAMDKREECDQCKGHGEVLLLNTEYDWQNHKILIGLVYFNPNYIDKLLYISGENDLAEIEYICGTPLGSNCFMIDGIEILIMPMRMADEDGNLAIESTIHKLEEEVIP
jgi:hypothetical protein